MTTPLTPEGRAAFALFIATADAARNEDTYDDTDSGYAPPRVASTMLPLARSAAVMCGVGEDVLDMYEHSTYDAWPLDLSFAEWCRVADGDQEPWDKAREALLPR